MDVRELQLTAELAAIRLKDGDLERLGAEVDRMLNYFEAMSTVDFAGLEPTTHAHVQGKRLRIDRAARSSTDANPAGTELADSLLDQAADLEGRLIVIPNVL